MSNGGSFSVTAANLTVTDGTTGSATITVTPANGYTGTISWAVYPNTTVADACYTIANSEVISRYGSSDRPTEYRYERIGLHDRRIHKGRQRKAIDCSRGGDRFERFATSHDEYDCRGFLRTGVRSRLCFQLAPPETVDLDGCCCHGDPRRYRGLRGLFHFFDDNDHGIRYQGNVHPERRRNGHDFVVHNRVGYDDADD